MKFRTHEVTFPCLPDHQDAAMQSKGFISLQSGLSNCVALTVHKRKPYMVLKPILTYRPSVTFLYLDTVKLLQAKFTLNIVPLSAVSGITPSINLLSCAAEFLGTKGIPWGKDCPAEYLFHCPQRSTPTAQLVAVIHCVYDLGGLWCQATAAFSFSAIASPRSKGSINMPIFLPWGLISHRLRIHTVF